jgi:hypothetical protein
MTVLSSTTPTLLITNIFTGIVLSILAKFFLKKIPTTLNCSLWIFDFDAKQIKQLIIFGVSTIFGIVECYFGGLFTSITFTFSSVMNALLIVFGASQTFYMLAKKALNL